MHQQKFQMRRYILCYYKNTKTRSTLKPIITYLPIQYIIINKLTTMALLWCCTRNRMVRGNFPTGVQQRYLTVASGDGKTEKSLRQPNCLWDERDKNETDEIPRRRVARSDDDELSLARTNSGSRCDSKFRAVSTDVVHSVFRRRSTNNRRSFGTNCPPLRLCRTRVPLWLARHSPKAYCPPVVEVI